MTMNIEQITEIAFAVARELEPQFSFDVFDVSEAQIIFQSERKLTTVCLSCLKGEPLKEQIKATLRKSN
jgi:hypothetical protein